MSKRRIESLQKRADYLRTRVSEADAKGKDLTYDKAELAALLWAIPILKTHNERTA